MIGAGSAYFAVWGYVISHMKPDRRHGMWVELNPSLIAFVLGEKVEVITEVIERMEKPDERSRSQEEGGRKLMRLGEYAYRVVNGLKYRRIRDEDERRDYQRNWVRNKRAKGKSSKPLPGEVEYERAYESGASASELDRMAEPKVVKPPHIMAGGNGG